MSWLNEWFEATTDGGKEGRALDYVPTECGEFQGWSSLDTQECAEALSERWLRGTGGTRCSRRWCCSAVLIGREIVDMESAALPLATHEWIILAWDSLSPVKPLSVHA